MIETIVSEIKENRFYKVLAIVMILLIIGQVAISIQTASVGTKITQLEKEIGLVSKVNDSLKEEIVRNSSLSVAYEKSKSYGFIEPTEIYYVGTIDVAVAQVRP